MNMIEIWVDKSNFRNTRTVEAGQRYINVAIPDERNNLPGGMIEIMVNKAHARA